VNISLLHHYFTDRLQENVSLSNYTNAKVGGIAACLVVEANSNSLALDADWLWKNEIPFLVLGSGANVLISSGHLEMVILLNRANKIELLEGNQESVIHAESGSILASVARFAAQNSLTGLEWAYTIPGTLGGAVYGNAGAFGGDMSKSLKMAHILHRQSGRITLSVEEMAYSYRSSALKRAPGEAIILGADLFVHQGDEAEIRSIMDANASKRKVSQPGGASMGSTFKNPVGDHAGRFFQAAGLKGTRIGGVQVSPVHSNFLINDGTGTPEDYYRLIKLIQGSVLEKSGINLELEIELLGNWQELA
jgi:UDP-N-acetylmuramate dehydrogenase